MLKKRNDSKEDVPIKTENENTAPIPLNEVAQQIAFLLVQHQRSLPERTGK